MTGGSGSPGQRRRGEGITLFSNPRFRGLAGQLLLVGLIVWLGYAILSNAAVNLEKQHISSGFGFLDNSAGFGIVATLGSWLVGYSEQSTYGEAFLVGLINTLAVAALAIVLATIIGFVLGIARLSSNWLLARLAETYIEILRNIPLLLQIFFWYFAVLRALPVPRRSLTPGGGIFLNTRGLFFPAPLGEPGLGWSLLALCCGLAGALLVHWYSRRRQIATGKPLRHGGLIIALCLAIGPGIFLATGMPVSWEIPALRGFNIQGGIVIIPEYAALVLALSLYTATFIGEIVRSGILAVSHGQTEAALAAGLTRGQALRLVVIPQAMRVIIPPLTSQYLNLTKNSSLAVAIAYPDLVSVFAGTSLNQTGQALEVLAITMAVYLLLSLVTSALMNWYNRRVALVER